MNLQNNLPKTDFDVLIIGGASAGLSAAIYASRQGLRTIVLTKTLGGQAALASVIENYPGIESVGGLELMEKFLAQAKKHGAECKYETVRSVVREQEFFRVVSSGGQYTSLSVILAFGLTPRNLEVPGEEELQGKGVCYCATCDAPLYKGRSVAVVGGTLEALDAALLLANFHCSVTLIHDKDDYPANRETFDQVKNNPNIILKLQTVVVRVEGTDRVTGIVTKDVSGEEFTIDVNGIFVEKGQRIDSGWLGDLVELNQRHAIVVTENNQTKTTGLFACGDVTPLRDKQVVVSSGDGARAALSAYHYIQKQRGKPALLVDWKHSS